MYWAAQLLGAATAAFALRALFGDVAHLGTTLPSGSDSQSFGLEIVMSFFLMFVIMALQPMTALLGRQQRLRSAAPYCLTPCSADRLPEHQ
jgi:glycerol uptake facilitator-like aquaporin